MISCPKCIYKFNSTCSALIGDLKKLMAFTGMEPEIDVKAISKGSMK